MVILLCIVICVAYCIYDRQRKNFKEEIKAVNDRVAAASKTIDILTDNMAAVNKIIKESGLCVTDADTPVPDSEKLQTFSP